MVWVGTALWVKHSVAMGRENTRQNGKINVIELSQTMQTHPEQHWRQLSLTSQGRLGFDLQCGCPNPLDLMNT